MGRADRGLNVVVERVDRRTLNRTLLSRQWLHPRPAASAAAVIEHLVGMQAQSPTAPYPGLRSRSTTFVPAELSELLLTRRAVRIATLRGTVHLHTAADAGPVREWVQPVLDRALRTTRRGAFDAVDRTALVAAVTELLQDAPMSSTALGAALVPRWPTVSAADLHQFARAFLPLVQVPPRGVWGRSGATTYAVASSWLGGPSPRPSPAGLIARYLAAYGPASVRDVQTWSGLTRLAEVTVGMSLRRYVDDDGGELLDVDLPLADPSAPVPAVFLAPFDDVTLSHADRRRVIGDDARRIVATSNGMVPGMVLVDGTVAASWRMAGPVAGPVAGRTLEVTPMRPLSRRELAALDRPGEDLLRFLTGTAGGTVEVHVR